MNGWLFFSRGFKVKKKQQVVVKKKEKKERGTKLEIVSLQHKKANFSVIVDTGNESWNFEKTVTKKRKSVATVGFSRGPARKTNSTDAEDATRSAISETTLSYSVIFLDANQ